MPTVLTARRLVLAAGALLALGGAPASAEPRPDCPFGLEPWTEFNLYLGRNTPDGEVGDVAFATFLANVVTPRFPDGLTVLDAAGQFRDGTTIITERTKVLVLLVPSRRDAKEAVLQIGKRYKQRFQQQSVLRTEKDVCLAFD